MERLEKYAQENNIPIMMKDGIEFLLEFIAKNNIKNILEIGSAIGYSAIRMASLDKSIKVTTIERDLERYQEAVRNIKDYKLDDQITIINDDAFNVELNEKFDLIFIDAAKSQYIKFFDRFKSNLKDNGFIVSDNLNFHGLVASDPKDLSRNVRGLVRKLSNYIEFLKNHDEFETRFYDLGDGVSISQRREVFMKKNAFTLVELLGVIVILAAIALVAFPPILNQIQKSQNEIDGAIEKIIVNAAKLYVEDNLDTYITSSANTYCLPLTTLIDSGQLSRGFIDSNDGISEDYLVEIKYSDNAFVYDVSKQCQENYLCKLTVDNDSDNQLDIGDEVTCGTESFYIIPDSQGSIISNNTVNMLAKYRIDLSTMIQNTSSDNLVDNHIQNFSSSTYWLDASSRVLSSYKPAGNSSFAYIYDSAQNNSETVIYYVEEYNEKLKETGVVTSTTKLMSYEQAISLGCYYNSSVAGYGTCGPAFPEDNIAELTVKAPSWIYNVSYWLGSYAGQNGAGEKRIWTIDIDGSFDVPAYNDQSIYHGVRPVVTISTNEIN